jgi:hypothetical protein
VTVAVLGGGTHLGQDCLGDAELREQVLVPRAVVDVVQHRPRGVCHVGRVGASEIVDEPGVNRADAKLSSLGAAAQ